MPPELRSVVAVLERRLIAGVIAVTLALLVLTTGIISRAALDAFEREVRPQLGREAVVIGAAIVTQFEHALAIGVPLDRLEGLEPFFEGFLQNRPTLSSIALTGPAGQPLKIVRQPGDAATDIAQDVMFPIRGPIGSVTGKVAELHVGVNASQLERSAADSRWDIGIVLLVSVLATIEALLFLADRSLGAPLRLVNRISARVAADDWTTRPPRGGTDEAGRFLARLNGVVRRVNARQQHVAWLADEVGRQSPGMRAGALGVIRRLMTEARFADGAPQIERAARSPVCARAPLFLYVFAEQLSTSFIPLFAQSVFAQPSGDGDGWITAGIAAGLPIAAFGGAIALATPFGAKLVGRYGAQAVLIAGCIPAALGYILAAMAGSIEGFIAARMVTAVGYALITIACQSYLVDASGADRRGGSMAVFVTAVMTGAVCGTAIGAVLADHAGFRATFLASAALTLGAGLLAARSMDRLAGRHAASPGSSGGALRLVLRHRGFAALVLFAALPAKIVLTGFVFYICPLFLSALGDTQSEIGRQVMLYGLTMLLTIRLGGWLADRFGAAASSIAAAGVATGAGLIAALLLPPALAVPIAIAVVGLSQGIASAAMLAVVPELCPALAEQVGLATLYGYLRFAERIGSIVGPVLAAVLVAGLGFAPAMAAIGAISLAATALYLASGSVQRSRT